MRYITSLSLLVAATTQALHMPGVAPMGQAVLHEHPRNKVDAEPATLTRKHRNVLSSPADPQQAASSRVVHSYTTTDNQDLDIPSVLSSLAVPQTSHRHHTAGDHTRRTDLTIYEAIQRSPHTRTLASLVAGYPDVIATLNSTAASVTVFVPPDSAFEKLPQIGKKFSKEFVRDLLYYHLAPGLWPARKVLSSHTIPSSYKAAGLGNKPQRLRIGAGLLGTRVNFFSKIVMTDIHAANGIIHLINTPLTQPAPSLRLLSLSPGTFSTLLLAGEKTGLWHTVDSAHSAGSGSTFFAPTNRAFRKLGPVANAYLFNSPKGVKYLEALLKYHHVPNQTLYSDAYYGPDRAPDTAETEGGRGRYHVELPTSLGHRTTVGLDISRWGGHTWMKVNGFVNVAIEDVCSATGVVHVVDAVLVPPRPNRRDGHREDAEGHGADECVVTADGEIGLKELLERLQPYVDEDEKAGEGPGVSEL